MNKIKKYAIIGTLGLSSLVGLAKLFDFSTVEDLRRNVLEVGGYDVHIIYSRSKTKNPPAEIRIGTAQTEKYLERNLGVEFISHEYPEIRAFDYDGHGGIDKILFWDIQGSPLEKFTNNEKLNEILQNSKKRMRLE